MLDNGLMALTRHKKFRPVLIAGVTAVIVGGTGAAFACTPWDESASASPVSDTIEVGASASSDTPTSVATSANASQRRQQHKHHHQGSTATASPSTTSSDDTDSDDTGSDDTGSDDTATTQPSDTSTDDSTAEPSQSSSASATTSAAESTTDSELAQFQAEVLELTNEEREAAGCEVDLTANADLQTAAQEHAEDMLENNYFDHESQDGTTPFERMTAAGYDWSAAAENIAAGQATPEAVMEAWMNSAGHKANILNCNLTELGVGYAAGSGADYGTYWVQDFGTPAS